MLPGKVLGDVIQQIHDHLLRLGLRLELFLLLLGKFINEICHLLVALEEHLIPDPCVYVTFCYCGY